MYEEIFKLIQPRNQQSVKVLKRYSSCRWKKISNQKSNRKELHDV